MGCQLQAQDERSEERCEVLPRPAGRSDQDSGGGDDSDGELELG